MKALLLLSLLAFLLPISVIAQNEPTRVVGNAGLDNNIDINLRSQNKKLQNRINELEDQLATCVSIGNYNEKELQGRIDELQCSINQIKADQLYFYAFPFSVRYQTLDQVEIPSSEMEVVSTVAKVLRDNSNKKVVIVGFCSHEGPDEYNMKISEYRANRVKRVLVSEYGIEEGRISVDYKGYGVSTGNRHLDNRVSFYFKMESCF